MFVRTRTWCLLSLMFMLASVLFWRLGEARRLRNTRPPAPSNAPALTTPRGANHSRIRPMQARGAEAVNTAPGVLPGRPLTLLTSLKTPLPSSLASPQTSPPAASANPRNRGRLSNTAKPIGELMRSDTAILLQNAFIDTAEAAPLEIPSHLRVQGDNQNFIVQSRGPIDATFRAQLANAGASVVAYIPNNAYLVRVPAGGAQQLAGYPGTRKVLAFEPYYKLEQRLLTLAVAQRPLPSSQLLKVTLFPNSNDQGAASIQALGADIVSESESPFGPLLMIRPPADSLVALAQLPDVQGIELASPRVMLNDLARQKVAVSADTITTTNYLGLTGSNVLVNVNEMGVDATHPDLQGRVLALDSIYLNDPEGHGTHVAGIIAGSGSKSDTVTNALGSLPGANFRGMAPMAKLFVLPADASTGPVFSDSYLQRNAALTNALISNNSWGYVGRFEYDISAASYDAAVRDALPDKTGSQPVLFVFAAGNSGQGGDDGLAGEPGTISSPASAKNVITVGALDQNRNITNEVVTTDDSGESITNQPWLGMTDSDDQVSSYSSRGNIGIGTEGPQGRFKPDVVAPGSFLVSTRATGFLIDTNPTRTIIDGPPGVQEVVPGALNNYFIFIPPNAISADIIAYPTIDGSNSFPGLPIYLKKGDFPSAANFDASGISEIHMPADFPISAGDWFYSVGNNSPDFVQFNLMTRLVLTNGYGTTYQVLKELDDGLGPFYRYETGTSMAAPVVSGTLALIQEFFEQKLPAQSRLTNSPALLKALLINGARSASPRYDLQVQTAINIQGWGVANLTNSLPLAMQDGAFDKSPLQFIDQNPTNALTTGESKTWHIKLSADGQSEPLRVTLVWTDPPGNPSAAIKLVNDLDLIVTNEDTGDVYFGNDIPAGSDFTEVANTNGVPVNDVVNNVENVFLPAPLGTNYAITIYGRRVNVNATPAVTNKTAQDYALVMSCGNGDLTNAFTLTLLTNANVRSPLTIITNGIPLMDQHVGANSPLAPTSAGSTNQWHFYVFTNLTFVDTQSTLTNGSNVAFITFLPPDLSRPRNLDADIDLYVSTNSALTNLDETAIATADKSTLPGGTEFVFYTNAALGTIYYVGVKSEDQQAAEYGLIGISSDQPFDSASGKNRLLRGMPVPIAIPDGSPQKPGQALIFAIGTFPITVGRVAVFTTVTHQDLGDLIGNLSHQNQFAVLFNHTLNDGRYSGTNTFIFDDSNQGSIPFARPTDGPGRLSSFIGTQNVGVWMLRVVDDTVTHTGRVDNVTIEVDPNPANLGLISTVLANSWDYFFVDVPAEATNLTVQLWDFKPSLPLNLYIRRGDIPNQNVFDKSTLIDPNLFTDPTQPQNVLTVGLGDVPPLAAGRYFIGVFNPNAVSVTYRINATLDFNLSGNLIQTFNAPNLPMAIKDDAVTVSTNFVPTDREILDVRVGVRIDHPRISDLVLHLVSPGGTRILLAENRGGSSTNYGSGNITNNTLVYTGFTDNTNLAHVPIKFAIPPFTTNSFVTTNKLSDFESVVATNYPAPAVVDGWTVETNTVTVTNSATAYSGKQMLALRLGRISRVLPTIAGRQYHLTFAYKAAATNLLSAQVVLDGLLQPWLIPTLSWQIYSLTFTALATGTVLDIGPALKREGILLDDFVIAEAGSTIYYFPEEPLEMLKAERSLGNWQLEIWDNRAGPPTNSVVPTLLSWQLQFFLATPNVFAVTLTNQVPYTSTVDGTDTRYFIVNVPRAARYATNVIVASGSVQMYYRRDGLPMGDSTTDPLWTQTTGAGDFKGFVLSTNQPPAAPLQPGQRYYLAVKNTNPNETNTFTIEVSFDRVDQPANFNLITLTNAIPYKQTITNGPALDYYQFVVTTNAASVNFQLFPTNGDVNLLIRKDTPVIDPLPTQSSYDYRSINPATNADSVIVYTNSLPVALSPGIWYLGVFNMENFPVTYSVVATESTNLLTNLIPLTNGVPLNFKINAGAVPTDYFLFRIAQTNSAARFELSNLSGNADLIIRRGQLPDATNYDAGSFSSGTVAEQILLATNAPADLILPDLNGDWYIAVLNREVFPVTFTLRAVATPHFISLTNGVPATNTVNTVLAGGGWQYYQFLVSSNATMAMFEAFPSNDNIALFARQATADPEPWPTATTYDYFSDQPGTNAEQIIIFTNSVPVPLTQGLWYLGVYNGGLTPVTYTVLATEFFEAVPPIITLTNTVAYTNTITLTNGLDYYQFTVASNANRAVFETLNADGNVDLYIHRGLPLPSPTNYNYFSTNASTNAENITLQLTSTPVPLMPGIWFLSISNADLKPVTYAIRASETIPTPITNLVISSTLIISNSQLGITWSSIIGATYQVQGTTNIAGTVWTAVSTNIIATATSTTYWVPLTTKYGFFRVVMLSGPIIIPPSTNLVISSTLVISSNQLSITWNSVIGSTYQVQGTTNIAGTVWTAVSTNIIATATNTTYWVPLTTKYGFFRVVLLSGPIIVPPTTNLVINPNLLITTNSLRLTWSSVIGGIYAIDGKVNITDNKWNSVATNILATATNTTYDVPLPNTNHYFRVAWLNAGTTNPPATNSPPQIDVTQSKMTTNGYVLAWTAPANLHFQVQFTTVIPPVWQTLTSITSQSTNYSFLDTSATNAPGKMRLYRLRQVP